MTKEAARIKALNLRKTYDRNIAEMQILQKIKDLHLCCDGEKIAIYYPLRYEISLMALVDLFPNCCFYLPVIQEELKFVRYRKNDILQKGPFQTYEPMGEALLPDEMDKIFIPCLATSRDYRRLGYGKGYYDRALANYSGTKIGICYEELQNWDIEMNSYDIILNLIL